MFGLDTGCRPNFGPCLVLLLFAGTGCGQSVGVGFDSGVIEVDSAPPQLDAEPPLMDSGPPPVDAKGPQWAMLGSNAQRSGQSAFAGPHVGVVRSVQVASDGLVAVEAIGEEGHVYVWTSHGIDGGRVMMLDPEGTELWRFPDDSGLYPDQGGVAGGSALTLDGTFLVKAFLEPESSTLEEPLMDLLFALDQDGALDWAWRYAGTAAPAERDDEHGAVAYGEDGTIYAVLGPFQDATGETDRWLHAFSSTGLFLWKWNREVGSAAMPLALGDGTVRVLVSRHWLSPPASDDGLYALDGSGEELWFNPLGAAHTLDKISVNRDGVTWVTGHENASNTYPTIIGVGSYGNTVFQIGYNGNKYDAIATPVAFLSNARPCYGISRREGTSNIEESGRLVCMIQGGGLTVWQVDTAGDPCGGLAVDNTDAIYAVTAGNGAPPMILGIESTGQRRFEVSYPASTNDMGCDFDRRAFFALSPALGNGRLYVGSMDGQLHIVE